MPGVTVDPVRLFHLMGCDPMTLEETRTLLLRFGLELDDVIEEEGVKKYKIDIPANRADLLCVEALAVNLKCFLNGEHPNYVLKEPKTKIIVKDSVKGVRSHLICAVLRGITFTDESVKSFIDFQDKLHHNLCRRRTLASIGTHDLDVCEGEFTYTAEKPEEISFVPLTGGDEVKGPQLYENLKHHQQLSKYLPLLDEHPTWPVIRDGKGRVMSLPPIINSQFSKISVNTKNVFVECTAVDYTRALNAVIVLCAAFSHYCSEPYTVEQVKVVIDGVETLSPQMPFNEFKVSSEYIKIVTGLQDLTDSDIVNLLKKMQLESTIESEGKLTVSIPPTRTDILHPCDIAEDVAISYGYNNIDKQCRKRLSSGKPLLMSEYCDRLSKEVAASLWNQILTFSLCSKKECYDLLEIPYDGLAAELKNAKTQDFEIVRTTLLGGLLRVTEKILNQPNIKNPLPLRLFEISDVCLLDDTQDTMARNERRFCATIADVKSRFQDLHGLLDRFFILNKAQKDDVKLVREDCPTCIPGQRAAIYYQNAKIGWIGVLHPKVLLNFQLTKPIVAFELKLQPFLEKH